MESDYIVGMLTKVVPIGNSRGIRIPKALLEQCGVGEEVELQVKGGTLILRPVATVRASWSTAFAAMAASGDDNLAHEEAPTASSFDEKEWQW